MKNGLLALAAAVLSLAGCGGGGSAPPAPTAPAAPVLTWTPQATKSFVFNWTSGAGALATEYRLREDPTSVSGYTQIAVIPGSATSYTLTDVSLPRRLNARYILQACNAVGCTDSQAVNVAGTLTAAVGYIKASNTGANDFFGISVALSADGGTLAIGSAFESSAAVGLNGSQTDESAPASGAVYVFTRNAGIWSQQAYLKASNTETGDGFGYVVALSADGNTLAAGAPGEDSNAAAVNGNQADNSAPGGGAVYVFTRSAGTWSQQAYVKASNTEAGDNFGVGLALSADSNTLAVNAGGEDSSVPGVNGAGAQADNSAVNSGAVYVFTRSSGSWSQQSYLKASNAAAGDLFGAESLALSADGSTLAVGAYDEDSNATGVNGNQADNSATNSGAVYMFTRSGTTWSQQGYLKASNPEIGDNFGGGLVVSADGSTLAVGALNEDSSATGLNGNQADNSAANSGAAYVFTRSGSSWNQQAYVKASNSGASDALGVYNLALSADGSTLAVGARSENGGATGVNGGLGGITRTDSGAVYLY
jgi:hypothetical protein